MSKKKEPKPFTKKQLVIIFKIAFLEAMALSIIVPTIQSSGEIPPPADQINELTNIQNNTVTVTVASGTGAGSTSVTYSPSYTSVPKLIVTSQATLISTFSITLINPIATFQSGSPQTWINMPATDNEIYGDTLGQHQIEINLVGVSSFRFGVNCMIASNTLGSYLTVMYLNSGVWTELNSAQRFLIDGSNGLCPSLAGERYGSVTYSSIPANAKTSVTHLRVDGVGGGGLNDNPQFSSLWIDYSTSATGSATTTIGITGQYRVCGTLALCTASPPVETLTTGFVIQVIFPIAVSSTFTFKFTWKAGTLV